MYALSTLYDVLTSTSPSNSLPSLLPNSIAWPRLALAPAGRRVVLDSREFWFPCDPALEAQAPTDFSPSQCTPSLIGAPLTTHHSVIRQPPPLHHAQRLVPVIPISSPSHSSTSPALYSLPSNHPVRNSSVTATLSATINIASTLGVTRRNTTRTFSSVLTTYWPSLSYMKTGMERGQNSRMLGSVRWWI